MPGCAPGRLGPGALGALGSPAIFCADFSVQTAAVG